MDHSSSRWLFPLHIASALWEDYITMQIDLTPHEVSLCIEGLRTVFKNRKECGELTKHESVLYEVLVGKLALALTSAKD